MLQPPTHEFLHRTVQARQMHEQFLKSLARHSDRIERCAGADRRIARLVGNERGFAENIAAIERCKLDPPALDSRLSLDDKVHFVAKIAVRENGFPSFKMLAVDRFIDLLRKAGDSEALGGRAEGARP